MAYFALSGNSIFGKWSVIRRLVLLETDLWNPSDIRPACLFIDCKSSFVKFELVCSLSLGIVRWSN